MLTQTEATTETGSEHTARLATSAPRIRLLVVDDHPAVRSGLRQLLGDQPDFNIVSVVETAEDALAVAEGHPIDVAIVDYQLGARNGLWVSRKLKRLPEPPGVVIYSAYASGHLAASCVIAEADGLVSKGGPGPELCDAIQSVARGRCHLPRVPSDLADLLRRRLDSKEQAIFGMLLAGIPRVEIAQIIGSSRAGLESHAAAMLGKLEALPGEAVELDSARSSARLHTRLDIQTQSARRADTSASVAEDPSVSAGRPVAERPDIRRHRAQPTRTANREAPLRRDSRAAPAPLIRAERPSRVPASPTVELPKSTSDEAADSGRGLLLFLTFGTAILVMVLAVWLAAAVRESWILIPVIAVDLIATTAVMVVIWMLGDGANPAQPDIRALPSIPGLERDPGGEGYADEPAQAA